MLRLAPADFADALEQEPVASLDEILEDMLRLLANQASSGELKGIALVNGLKAVAQLQASRQAQPERKDDETHLSIVDRIDSLPPEHARGLVQQEIERLETEVAGLYEALTRLGA